MWLYQVCRRAGFAIGLLPIFTNKGMGLTWPGHLHNRIRWRVGRALIKAGRFIAGRY